MSSAYRKADTRGQHHAVFDGGVTRSRARRPPRRIQRRRIRGVGLLVAIAAIPPLAYQLAPSSSSPAAAPVDLPGSAHEGALGEADGAIPDGTSVFDDDVPGVAELDPGLRGALRRATASAAADGVEIRDDSGWRSRRYQERLLHEAISTYGSEAEAARWVATPETSAHVSGDAVDLGHADATAWLSVNGAAYGLCQTYVNERWHYELRPAAVDRGCPAMYADPTHDPRMQG